MHAYEIPIGVAAVLVREHERAHEARPARALLPREQHGRERKQRVGERERVVHLADGHEREPAEHEVRERDRVDREVEQHTTCQRGVGEPLRAEIDIPQIAADEVASFNAGIGSPEAFRAAGLERSNILASPAELAVAGVRVEQIDRGGDVVDTGRQRTVRHRPGHHHHDHAQGTSRPSPQHPATSRAARRAVLLRPGGPGRNWRSAT